MNLATASLDAVASAVSRFFTMVSDWVLMVRLRIHRLKASASIASSLAARMRASSVGEIVASCKRLDTSVILILPRWSRPARRRNTFHCCATDMPTLLRAPWVSLKSAASSTSSTTPLPPWLR